MNVQKVELISNEGYKFEVFLTQYEIERFETEPEFANELVAKYDTLRKGNIIRSVRAGSEEKEEPEQYKIEVWNEKETKSLISLYNEHFDDMQHAQRKKHIWSIISEKLASVGINKCAEKCQRKWINLTRVYRSIKDNSNKTGRGRTSYKYFNILDDILGKRPSNCSSTYVIDLGASTSLPETSSSAASSIIDNLPDVNPTFEETGNTNCEEKENSSETIPPKKKKTNYTQEYFKNKINFLEKKNCEKEMIKERRHQERLEVEKSRNNIEAEKVQLLKEILSKLNS